ncbi:MAG: ADP-ribosylglycohydrolase family protein [Anaerolineae bacterium]|nr:ADP-ribosylglycohydrolase family protein [Anaerolineae bacterium]
MNLPHDYVERTYAGVLGKLIGVYLGRPFEQWTYERIRAELGDITYYVHEKRGLPLVVTDDDISGTFTFLRALPDYGNKRDITPQQIGQTWLNYIIEKRTILWWGGFGNSTEHTAYLRLKNGISAPQSGSIALNTRTVAEQIGAQIFIDGWAMVAPGDPEFAADLARRAASVSHDGEAVYGAQVIAAMESQAYVEKDINRLLDTAITLIPKDSIIRRLIDDVREWHSEFKDWHNAREQIAARYGYDKYGGNCHIVPNHALIILSLLYGEDDFQKALLIVNTAGWDTDCNSGNVGCLLGIKNGLAGIDMGPDWRGPIADRLYLPTADGGSAITDAVTETYRIADIGHALAGKTMSHPKNGSRFHFEMPGSVQGFREDTSVESKNLVTLENVEGYSQTGKRSLAIRYHHLAPGRNARAATSTFIPPEDINMPGYELHASPLLYPGQTLHAGFMADPVNKGIVTCRLYIQVYGANDQLVFLHGPQTWLKPGEVTQTKWHLDDPHATPIAQVGLEITTTDKRSDGTIYLDYVTWDGEPHVIFQKPSFNGTMWRRAWVKGVDPVDPYGFEAFRVVQNQGTGLVMQGCRQWANYAIKSTIMPRLAGAAGIGARVQGMRRYYALLLCGDSKARLVKSLDGEKILGEVDYPWKPEQEYLLQLDVNGSHLYGYIQGQMVFEVDDTDQPLTTGGIALVCTEGRLATESITVTPL